MKREPTNCGIESAGGKTKKGILPFCGVASGIAAIWGRNHSVHCGQKAEAGKQEHNEKY
jgi:hypothetical protein